jgi:hypothetical protein
MKTLNEITQEMLKINDLIESSIDEHGEIRPEVADALADYFNAVAQTRSQKIEAYLALIREKQMREAGALAQEDQWSLKRKAEAAGVLWLKEKLRQHMELTGETRIETDTGRVVSIQKNGGQPPLVVNEEKLNALTGEELAMLEKMGLIVMQPMLDKAEVRKLLAEGKSGLGLGEPGTHLRIR